MFFIHFDHENSPRLKINVGNVYQDTSCILVSDMEKPNHSEKLRKELQDEKLFQPIVCMLCTGPLHA